MTTHRTATPETLNLRAANRRRLAERHVERHVERHRVPGIEQAFYGVCAAVRFCWFLLVGERPAGACDRRWS